MCGVCASSSPQPGTAARLVDELNQAQSHRGPDGAASVVADTWCLGNTRLAVITPGGAGDQPLVEAEGACTAVFNGEVYNYRELIRDHGLRPGGSDGAVIPQLYARYGARAFRLLRGMFAVVLADHRTRRLVLARDQLGIKPLHWRQDGQTLRVASEVRPLLLPGDTVDRAALRRFLHLGSLPSAASPFAEIRALAPNTWLVLDSGGPVDSGEIEPGLDLTRGRSVDLADALRESVRLHLRSDVPTALLLSSGLDSSAVAWAAQEVGSSLHCLTVDLGGGRTEAAEAAVTARAYGHTHELVRHAPTSDDVQRFFHAMQRPTIDGLNTFAVCRAVREAGFKVALSGLGGDEATAGYSHFRYLPLLRAAARAPGLPAVARAVPARAAARTRSKRLELLTSVGAVDAWQLSALQRRLWPAALVSQALRDVGPVDLMQESPVGTGRLDAASLTAAEYRLYLQSTLLPDADAFSMVSSVELRVPLVDREFLAASVTAGGPAGLRKRGFAKALGQARLTQLAQAPKQGFSLPMDAWMRSGLLRPAVDDCTSSSALVWDHLDRSIGAQVIDGWRTGRLPWSHAWALVALDQWLRTLSPAQQGSSSARH